MKKIIYLLLISHLTFAQKAILDTNTINIGEQTTLRISNELHNTKSWPSYEKFIVEGVEIIERSKIDTINGIISQLFIITAWDSGSYYIPVIEFSENNKTRGNILNVQSLNLEENAQLKDIKGPIQEPIGWSDIWPWLFGFLLIVLIVYLIRKYMLKKKKIIKTKPKRIIPPHIIALEKLRELEKKQVWESGKIKEYHTKLSEIIRRYIEERYKFIALELTTDEILNELKNELKAQEINNIKTLLERADLAKFAKSKPIRKENIESMNLAKNFVNITKQKIKNG